MAALVFGLSNAPTDQHGISHWGDTKVVVALVVAAVLQGFSRGFLVSFAITVLALGVIAVLIRQPCPVTEDQPVPIGCPGYHWRRPRVLAFPVLRRETPLRPAGPG